MAAKKFVFAFNRRGGETGRQVGDRCGAAEIVGERHEGAAMQKAIRVGEFFAHRERARDPFGREVSHRDADERGEWSEWRLLFDRRIRHGVSLCHPSHDALMAPQKHPPGEPMTLGHARLPCPLSACGPAAVRCDHSGKPALRKPSSSLA
jgi:hypothetical protein